MMVVLAPLGAGPPVSPCRPGPSSAWSLVDGVELDERGEDGQRVPGVVMVITAGTSKQTIKQMNKNNT